jgi:hypothetical protein
MGKMNRVEKNWTELDFSKVDLEVGGGWTWGRGGMPLASYEYSISSFDDEGNETRYKLPDCISKMCAMQERFGANKARRAIREALLDE